MQFRYIFATLILYVSFSAAWLSPADLFGRSSSNGLVIRDDPPKSSAAPASSANTAQNTGSSSGSAAPSSKPTDKPDGNKDDGNKGNSTVTPTTSVSITQAEAGGISMIQPPITSATYYKIGYNITWIWNYTSLAVTPQAVDILVECQARAATYTIATNVSVAPTATVVWTGDQQSAEELQLITEKYTLNVYDAGNPAGPTQIVTPGKLGSWSGFQFGMYNKQHYDAIGGGYQCVTCNGAVSSIARQSFGVIFGMAAITVMSFTWFANGFLGL